MKKIYFIFNKEIHEEELHSDSDITRWFTFLIGEKTVIIKKIYASLGEAEQALKQKKLTKKQGKNETKN